MERDLVVIGVPDSKDLNSADHLMALLRQVRLDSKRFTFGWCSSQHSLSFAPYNQMRMQLAKIVAARARAVHILDPQRDHVKWEPFVETANVRKNTNGLLDFLAQHGQNLVYLGYQQS